MGKIKTIYVTDKAQEVFSKLEDMRPKNISFSEMLSITAKEFITKHDPKNMRLEDFESDNEVVPNFYSDITVWRELIMKSDTGRLREIQERLVQLENLVRQREEVLLR